MYFPPKFNLKRAIELVDLVSMAYDQYEACKKKKPWSLPPVYTLVKELYYTVAEEEKESKSENFFDREFQSMMKYFSKKKVRGLPIGFIARRKTDLFIIFRGTMTATEWLSNLNFSLKPYLQRDFGKVHEGFLEMYEVLRQEIYEGVKDLENLKRIFISGHSLGGAIATLLVPDIAARGLFQSIIVYTFASPRVGNNAFAEAYNQLFARQTFRVANTSDLVVSMPPPVTLIGMGGYFSHVDTPVDFTVQNNDVEKNHAITVYQEILKGNRQPWWFLINFFR